MSWTVSEESFNTREEVYKEYGKSGCQRTHDLRLTPLRSELAVQETRGHSGVQPASPVRVRAVDWCPFTQAYSRGYSFFRASA